MKQKSMVLLGVGTALGAALARWQMARFFAEQPEYEVEDRLGQLEIRHYDRVVRAETTVEAQTWEDALQEGFRRLASYIFGANRPRELALSELELQGVQATPQATRAQKIAMTAPLAKMYAKCSAPGSDCKPTTGTAAVQMMMNSGPSFDAPRASAYSARNTMSVHMPNRM